MIRDLCSLHYPINLSNTELQVKECRILKFGCNMKKKLMAVNASASGSGNSKSIETINGKKINGVHVGKRGNVLIEPGSSSSSSSVNHSYMLGNFVDARFVYRQSFVIRSYEIGPDKTATMETIMNLLQVRLFLKFQLRSSMILNHIVDIWLLYYLLFLFFFIMLDFDYDILVNRGKGTNYTHQTRLHWICYCQFLPTLFL